MRSFVVLKQLMRADWFLKGSAAPLFRFWPLAGLLFATTATLAGFSPQVSVELPCNPDTLVTRLHYEGMLTRMANAQANEPDPGSPFIGLFQTPTAALDIVADSATCAAAGMALRGVDSTLIPDVVTVLQFGSSGYSVHTSLDEDTYFFFDPAWRYLGALAGI